MTKKERINVIAEMLNNGKTNDEIIAYTQAEKWGVATKTVQGYITKAKALKKDDTPVADTKTDDTSNETSETEKEDKAKADRLDAERIEKEKELEAKKEQEEEEERIANEKADKLDDMFLEAEKRGIDTSKLQEKAKDDDELIELYENKIKKHDKRAEKKAKKTKETQEKQEKAEAEYRKIDEANIKAIHTVLKSLIDKTEKAIKHRRDAGRSIKRLVSVKKQANTNLNRYVK